MKFVILQTIIQRALKVIINDPIITTFTVTRFRHQPFLQIEMTPLSDKTLRAIYELEASHLTDEDDEHAWFRHEGVLVSRDDRRVGMYRVTSALLVDPQEFRIDDLPTFDETHVDQFSDSFIMAAIMAAIDQDLFNKYADFLRHQTPA